MPRLFFGLDIPPDIKRRLLKVRTSVPGAKWQTAAQLHLTLRFMGQVEEEQLADLCDAAGHVSNAPFQLRVIGLGCFGSPQKPRNLWAGVDPVGPVDELHRALQAQLEPLGVGPDKKPYRPHITLSRFKREAGSVETILADRGDDEFGQFSVSEFFLFGSQPGETGSQYSVIERFPLAT